MRKAEFYNSRERLLKRITVEATMTSQAGVELATLISVQNLRKKKETSLSFADLRYGVALDPALFSPLLD